MHNIIEKDCKKFHPYLSFSLKLLGKKLEIMCKLYFKPVSLQRTF